MDSDGERRPSNPRASCNAISAFTLTWTTNIYKLGTRKSIDISDVYEPLQEYSSGILGKKSWAFWEAEKSNNNPRIYKVILKLFKWEIISYFILALLRECVLRVAQPIFLGYFMSYYVHQKSLVTYEQSVLSAICLVICSLLYSIFGHPCAMGVFHLGMKYRATLCALVYRKCLRLSSAVLSETNLGHMVNLLSNDIRRFDLGTVLLNYLIVSPIQMCIMTYFIWMQIGISSLVGLGVLVAQIPFQFWMGDRISKVRAQTAALTDTRVQLTNEVISGIQVIKMYSWEDWFTKLVNVCRQKEIDKIKYSSYLRGINISLRIFNTRLCIFASLTFYVLLGNEINAQKVFVTVCFYEILKQTMTVWFPDSINQIKELTATFKRFETFLLKEESSINTNSKDERKQNSSDNDEAHDPLIKNDKLPDIKFQFDSQDNCTNAQDDKPADEEETLEINTNDIRNNIIIIRNIYAKWEANNEKYTLKDVSFNVATGSFIAITGCVASGKSSLLCTMFRELDCIRGYIKCNASISYSSQVPWLFAGTIRQNILFGSQMNEELYGNVCKVCALEEDFEMLPNGDLTLVGDRGITLSGGQRGRIGLARAVYRDADIYLLDDPFSAVDTKVGRQLFDDCIVKMLREKGKTIVLVTHQVQYLSEADHIIVLKDGSVVSQGKFQSLISCEEFTKLLSIDVEINNIEENRGSASYSLKRILNEKEKIKSIGSMKCGDEEDCNKGNVEWKVYLSYVRSCGTKLLLISFLVLAIFTQLLASGFDYWTKYWVSLEESKVENNNISIINLNSSDFDNNITNLASLNFTYMFGRSDFIDTLEAYLNDYGDLTIYSLILIGLIFMTLCRTMLFYWMAMNASVKFHHQMLRSVVRATMNFFHHNTVGRILNRFSQDIGAIDDLLPLLTMEVIQVSLQLLGIVIIVSLMNVWLFLPMILLVVIIYHLKNIYLKTSRSITRCEAAARSCVFSHLSASMQGLATIRAMSAQDIVTKQFDSHNDVYSSASHMFIGVSRAFAYWMDLVCVIFIAIVTFSFLFGSDVIGGNIGLAITQVIGLTTVLQWGVRQATTLENQMISVERIQEYSNLYPEPPLEMTTDKELPMKWPHSGHLDSSEAKAQIELDNIHLTYSRTENPSLNGVSFTVEPKQKVGIVGRTGAGKTSIINALFRLNSFEGKIKIDGINITKIGLQTLRSKISIIPQEPVLFSGSLRRNLDPFDKYNDDDLYEALEQVKLKGIPLHHNVSERGSNFSVGERQLICLARSIILGNKIIVLDEATANVDNETDSIIQTTMKEKFSDCTIITIAHRLHTIMDSDKIIVMDAGRIVECGSPLDLINDPTSILYSMVEGTGSCTGQHLMKIVKECNTKS